MDVLDSVRSAMDRRLQPRRSSDVLEPRHRGLPAQHVAQPDVRAARRRPAARGRSGGRSRRPGTARPRSPCCRTICPSTTQRWPFTPRSRDARQGQVRPPDRVVARVGHRRGDLGRGCVDEGVVGDVHPPGPCTPCHGAMVGHASGRHQRGLPPAPGYRSVWFRSRSMFVPRRPREGHRRSTARPGDHRGQPLGPAGTQRPGAPRSRGVRPARGHAVGRCHQRAVPRRGPRAGQGPGRGRRRRSATASPS